MADSESETGFSSPASPEIPIPQSSQAPVSNVNICRQLSFQTPNSRPSTSKTATSTSTLNALAKGFSNTQNVTPISGSLQITTRGPYTDPRSKPSSFAKENVQNPLFEILSEVKKTNARLDSYDKKMTAFEERLKSLEEAQHSQSPSSSDTTDHRKRKVPSHIRVSGMCA